MGGIGWRRRGYCEWRGCGGSGNGGNAGEALTALVVCGLQRSATGLAGKVGGAEGGGQGEDGWSGAVAQGAVAQRWSVHIFLPLGAQGGTCGTSVCTTLAARSGLADDRPRDGGQLVLGPRDRPVGQLDLELGARSDCPRVAEHGPRPGGGAGL